MLLPCSYVTKIWKIILNKVNMIVFVKPMLKTTLNYSLINIFSLLFILMEAHVFSRTKSINQFAFIIAISIFWKNRFHSSKTNNLGKNRWWIKNVLVGFMREVLHYETWGWAVFKVYAFLIRHFTLNSRKTRWLAVHASSSLFWDWMDYTPQNLYTSIRQSRQRPL